MTSQLTTGDVSLSNIVGSAIQSGGQSDDYTILTKNDCAGANPGNKKALGNFSGYLSGIRSQPNSALLAGALYCGWIIQPGAGGQWNTKNQSDTQRFNWQGEGPKNPYWSVQDLTGALGGKAKIQCDFTLNSVDAPADPNPNLMSHCCPLPTTRSC